MIEPIQKYTFGNLEVHTFGVYVGVCWELTKKEKTVFIDGEKYTKEVMIRKTNFDPYIDFISIRKFEGMKKKSELWPDETCSVEGGISVFSAKKVIAELQTAIAYIKEQTEI